MDDKRLRQRIHQAVDANGSSLSPDPYLAQRVLRAATAPRRPLRKVRAAAVLIMALMLAAVTAVAAALLSMRQLVDETAVPLAQQSQGESYTIAETSLLVQLAQQNGITLSARTLEQIAFAESQGEGYYKEELLMAMAKAEFGENPGAWTLEEQAWFDDVCVAIGFIDAPQKAMASDDARSLAIRRAVEYLTAHDPIVGDLMDDAQYHIGVQYINGDNDGEFPGNYWSVTFLPQQLEGGEYWVYLNDEGAILGDSIRPGLSADSTVSDVRDAYLRIHGTSVRWEQDVLQSFREAVLKATDTDSRAYLCISRVTYPDVPAGAITCEAAYDIAAQAIGVENKRHPQAYLIGTDGNPVWKFSIGSADETWSFEIDCMTGEIKTQRLLDNMHRKWWMSFTLWAISDEVDANWVDDSPSFG